VRPRKTVELPKDAKPREYPPPSMPPVCLPAQEVGEGWGYMLILNKEPRS
jgi:hypothetical protein